MCGKQTSLCVYISLVSREIKHLFICLLAIWIFFCGLLPWVAHSSGRFTRVLCVLTLCITLCNSPLTLGLDMWLTLDKGMLADGMQSILIMCGWAYPLLLLQTPWKHDALVGLLISKEWQMYGANLTQAQPSPTKISRTIAADPQTWVKISDCCFKPSSLGWFVMQPNYVILLLCDLTYSMFFIFFSVSQFL